MRSMFDIMLEDAVKLKRRGDIYLLLWAIQSVLLAVALAEVMHLKGFF